MSRIILKGATSQSVYFDVLDSTSTTGGRKTGLVFNTSSLTAYYVRNGGSATAITLATLAAANSAFSSGGFKEVDATNMPGVYRLDVPDAAFAAGSGDSVVVTIKGASGMVQASHDIQLSSVNLQDSVRAGMTALPNAAAEAAGGLYTRGTGAGQINQDGNGRVDVNAVRMSGTALTARDIGLSVLLSNGTGAGQLKLASGYVAMTWADIAAPSTTVNLSGTSISLVGGVTGNVTGSVGSVLGSVASVVGNVGGDLAGSVLGDVAGNLIGNVYGTINDKTGYELTSGERDSVADALLDRSNAIETGVTPRGILRLIGAVIAGKVSGAATTTNTFRNAVADSKNRVVATVDASGNRSAITTDMT